MLMNSFSTSDDTLAALSKYPELGTGPSPDSVTSADRVPQYFHFWSTERGQSECFLFV